MIYVRQLLIPLILKKGKKFRMFSTRAECHLYENGKANIEYEKYTYEIDAVNGIGSTCLATGCDA